MSSERRLHPLSLFFGLGRSIRHLFDFPLLVATFATRARVEQEPWFFAFLIIPSTLHSIFHYLTLRYRYDEKELVIRSGVFVRNERHIPYERIQNIDAVQTLAHRVLGVVTVLVQTGSGKGPEGTLSVLPVAALEEMRERVFAGAQAVRAPKAVDKDAAIIAGATAFAELPVASPVPVPRAPISDIAPHEILLHLEPKQLLLCGLNENRGVEVVLGAAGVFLQLDQLHGLIARAIESRAPWLAELSETAGASFKSGGIPIRGIILAVVALLVFLAIVRAGAAVWTVIRLFDFRVSKHGEDLRVEHGFLTRVVNTIPLRRIQWVVVDETILHRLLGQVAVRVTTAGAKMNAREAGGDREWLAPILPRAAVRRLVETVQPGLNLDVALRRAHPRGFWRAMTVATVFALPLSALLAPFIGWWALAIFVGLELRALVLAVLLLDNLGWGVTDTSIIFRGGRFKRHTAGARFSRMQTVTYEESPFDRQTRMATVRVDTAGAHGAHLEMRYLPRADAQELRNLLAIKTAETAFVW